MSRTLALLALLLASTVAAGADPPLKVGVFTVDASPPVGSPLV